MERRTNEQYGLGSAPSARKGVFVTILCSFSCICWLSWACIFRETSTKGTNNTDVFSRWLTQPLCRSSDLGSHLSDFCWLSFSGQPTQNQPLSSALRCRLLRLGSFVNWPSVFSRTYFPSSTSGLVEDHELKPFVLVSHQTKRFSVQRTHPHSVTLESIKLCTLFMLRIVM